ARLRHIERLDPERITPDEQAAAACIPQRERKHAVEMPNEVVTVLLVEMEDRLAVGAGAESMPACCKCSAQFAVVVDFAIGDQPQRAVFVGERLLARGKRDVWAPPHS